MPLGPYPLYFAVPGRANEYGIIVQGLRGACTVRCGVSWAVRATERNPGAWITGWNGAPRGLLRGPLVDSFRRALPRGWTSSYNRKLRRPLWKRRNGDDQQPNIAIPQKATRPKGQNEPLLESFCAINLAHHPARPSAASSLFSLACPVALSNQHTGSLLRGMCACETDGCAPPITGAGDALSTAPKPGGGQMQPLSYPRTPPYSQGARASTEHQRLCITSQTSQTQCLPHQCRVPMSQHELKR